RGLRSVALDRAQEDVLLRDLERFAGDREFYAKIGMPYRRGYLFSGPPGTGKTSLVQAISATYGRDLYYLNLKEIKDDAMLQSAFSNVPKNSIIVLEDVDAQSTIEPAFRRKRKSGPSNKKGLGLSDFFGPTLSALLNCLDGYSTNEGLVVIMTSNHPELLDPALVRPGRIDLHLELGYATHYQLQRMY
ncbi:P-loop containing nucleoside triphosphate hydrolase protein, partial [Hyaloraphidium curvatum]